MIQSVHVLVRNQTNSHILFERDLDIPDGVSIPFNQVCDSLYWLYDGMNVNIEFHYSKYDNKMNCK